ncbi:MAG: mechanosensitive ion channel [Bacteroidaceae bacterium]|nr:mechanosensitive ion channel [Bacteroidaceae bacterium]
MNEETVSSSLSLDLSHLALSDLVSFATSACKNLVIAALVFFIGRFIIKRIIMLVRKIMEKKNMDPSLFTFLDSLISITLNFVLAIAVIGILGIETSSFVALFASAGVAIGMALSGTMQNFAGGVMVLIFKPYKIGDYIEAAGFAGTVKEIQIFNTILITPDNQTIIIPNNSLSTSSMRNYSTATHRRVDIDVEVAYGTDAAKVREILEEIINENPLILKEGAYAPAIPMTAMKGSSIEFQMRMWVESANYWGVKFDVTEKVYTVLTERGIEIPFQQLDVHLKQ